LSASLISEFTTTFGTEWSNKWFKLITRRLWVTISRIHWCYPTCVSHVFIGVYELQYLSLKEFLLWFKIKVNCNYPVGKHSWWTMVSLYTIAFCTKKRSRVMDSINCQVLSILDTCFYSHENLTNFFLLNRKMESFFFNYFFHVLCCTQMFWMTDHFAGCINYIIPICVIWFSAFLGDWSSL